MGYCDTDVHTPAHRLEHFTDEGMQVALDREIGSPLTDPHDRTIPPGKSQ
jgi:Mn-dependent DtxR family transcriptional regulator